jgi:DNA-binding NarL/FixJ family response regulator
MAKPINLAIVDDHSLFRDGLIVLLKEFDNINIVFDVSNGKELLAELKLKKPDVILLDIEMPVMNGKEALYKINLKYSKIKVIMMSSHFNDDYIFEFIKNGACAFLPKNCDIEIILKAINSVFELGYYYDDKVSNAIASLLKKSPSSINEVVADSDFTKREIEIIKLICDKKSNIDIAEELSLSVRTIEGHRYNISKKTKTSNTINLIEYAIQNNILNFF